MKARGSEVLPEFYLCVCITEKIVLKFPTRIELVLGASVVVCFKKELGSGEQPAEDLAMCCPLHPQSPCAIPPVSLHLLLLQHLLGGRSALRSARMHLELLQLCSLPLLGLWSSTLSVILKSSLSSFLLRKPH